MTTLKQLAIATILLLTTTQACRADTGIVRGVADGDTVTIITHDRQQVKCRLAGIDAPEKAMPMGQKAKQALSDLVFGKYVVYQVIDIDRYGRSVCKLQYDGQDVNRKLVVDGWAWVYRRYTDDQALIAAERQARAARRGLWRDPNPQAPWDYRRSS